MDNRRFHMDQSRVLLVDDDTDILEINKTFLEGEGYEVSTATNIAQTMEKVMHLSSSSLQESRLKIR